MGKQLKGFKLFNAIVSLVIIAGCAWVIWQRQAVIDWWRLQNYQPPADIAQLADQTTMVDRGRDMFYASMPAIENRDTFNQHCNNTNEHTIVLGCYRAQQIYLFAVTDKRLNGVEQVTAAHEMLHAAYERLDNTERRHIDNLLDAQMKQVTDQRIIELIGLYKEANASELYNEMHSILGTEYGNLSAELEAYYNKYFADRKKVVGYSEAYEAVFSASKAHIAQLDASLNELKRQIDANNAGLEAQQIELQNDAQRLNRLRADRDFAAYNAAVPEYNQKVRDFNALIAQTKQLVDQYNAIVADRNREAAAQTNLYQSLDSRYEAKPTE